MSEEFGLNTSQEEILDQEWPEQEEEEEEEFGQEVDPLQEGAEHEVFYNEGDEDDEALFAESLRLLSSEVSALHSLSSSSGDFAPSWWNSASEDERIAEAVDRVESAVEEQILSLETMGSLGYEHGPAFVYPNLFSWRNVRFCGRRGLVPCRRPDGSARVQTSTVLLRRSSARKFSLLLLCLSEVWSLLRSRSFSTRRDLFYRRPQDFRSQAEVDAALVILSAMLQVPRIHLRVLATSKGMVAGSLSFVSALGVEVTR